MGITVCRRITYSMQTYMLAVQSLVSAFALLFECCAATMTVYLSQGCRNGPMTGSLRSHTRSAVKLSQS